MTDVQRPRPEVTEASAPFWSSVAEHAMRLQRCEACGTYRFYPTPICPSCYSSAFTWAAVSGAATLYSFSVVYRPVTEAFTAQTPYVVALVTLQEGPTMMMNLVDVPPEAIEIGMPLRISYRDMDGFTLPAASAEPQR